MMTRMIGVSLVALLAACGSKDENATAAANDAGSDTAVAGNELTLETWQIDFWGQKDAPYHAARLDGIGKALAAGGSDVVCLHYLWRNAHRDRVIAAAKPHYAHVAAFESNLDTPVSDPTDDTGMVVPPRAEPPCSAAPDTVARIDSMYSCLAKSCSSIPDSMDGRFTNFDCYTSNCLAEGVDVITKDPRCAACGAINLEDATYAEGKSECTTNKNGGLIFDGANATVILSKYPIKSSELHVLPSTNIRRSVVRAELDVGGKSVEVYCGTLGNQPNDFTQPYVGQYGKGKTDVEGWIAENLLQAQKVVSFVKKTSKGAAVVMIDTRQSKEVKEGDKIVITKSNTSGAIDTLAAGLTQATPPGTSLCNFCNDHPGHPDQPQYLSEYVFFKDLPKTAMKSMVASRKERLYTGGDGKLYPLAASYSLRTTIALP